MTYQIVDVRTNRAVFSTNAEWIAEEVYKFWKSPWKEFVLKVSLK